MTPDGLARGGFIRAVCAIGFALLGVVVHAGSPAGPPASLGVVHFQDRRNPPTLDTLDAASQAQVDLGQSIFNTQWLPAGAPRAERIDGLGPLYVSASCDSCHNNGARGRPSGKAGLPPNSFVMQLSRPAGSAYGDVFNTAAIDGFVREGRVTVRFEERTGTFGDGLPWTLRSPHYELTDLAYGPLDAAIVLRPRIGPALFGVGLIEQVPLYELYRVRRSQPASVRGAIKWQHIGKERVPGRLGWQADAVSIQDQTQRALSREMGLTTEGRPQDDCTEAQRACVHAVNGGTPEVSPQFLSALVAFQRELPVPDNANPVPDGGEAVFSSLGCAVCHQQTLAIATTQGPRSIRAYTDLLVHDMGPGLADQTVAGHTVRSRWRTAPLWGLGHALEDRDLALLHDGRAGSLQQAILWHGGQARRSAEAFRRLDKEDRERLLAWLATL